MTAPVGRHLFLFLQIKYLFALNELKKGVVPRKTCLLLCYLVLMHLQNHNYFRDDHNKTLQHVTKVYDVKGQLKQNYSIIGV